MTKSHLTLFFVLTLGLSLMIGVGPATSQSTSNGLVLNFQIIDDYVKVYINGEEVYTHGIIRHGDPAVQVDLTDKLVTSQRNEVRIVAFNGAGSGTLIGDLNFAGQKMLQWSIRGQSTGKGNFLEQTIYLAHYVR